MRQLHEIYEELEELLGRRLTNDEIDLCYIMQITGNFKVSEYCHAYLDVATPRGAGWCRNNLGRFDRKGDMRYRAVARPGNPIDWQAVPESVANHYTGILLVPEHKGNEVCCAQFPDRRPKRVWMSIEKAESVIRHMVAGVSLLNAIYE